MSAPAGYRQCGNLFSPCCGAQMASVLPIDARAAAAWPGCPMQGPRTRRAWAARCRPARRPIQTDSTPTRWSGRGTPSSVSVPGLLAPACACVLAGWQCWLAAWLAGNAAWLAGHLVQLLCADARRRGGPTPSDLPPSPLPSLCCSESGWRDNADLQPVVDQLWRCQLSCTLRQAVLSPAVSRGLVRSLVRAWAAAAGVRCQLGVDSVV